MRNLSAAQTGTTHRVWEKEGARMFDKVADQHARGTSESITAIVAAHEKK